MAQNHTADSAAHANSTSPVRVDKAETKLSDTQVAQVIEEVSTEQEDAQSTPAPPEKAEESEEQFRGFIGKFTSKFNELKNKDDEH